MESSVEKQILYFENNLKLRPFVTEESLKEILSQCYGFEIDRNLSPKELVSFDDRNFLVHGKVIFWLYFWLNCWLYKGIPS